MSRRLGPVFVAPYAATRGGRICGRAATGERAQSPLRLAIYRVIRADCTAEEFL